VDQSEPVVVKFYRPARWTDAQIAEEHAFARELSAAEIPVVAPLSIAGRTLFHHGSMRLAIYPRRGGRAPELEDEAVLRRLGHYLGRLHVVGAARDFVHRPALTVESFGLDARDYLLGSDRIPRALLPAWRGICEQALQACGAAFARAGGLALVRCHGDCHGGNVLWTENGPHIVDLDDARMAPPVQDLWMLLGGERDLARRQLRVVLEGYEQFRDFDDRELALIEPLRTLRLLHYSAWLARRWHDPAFPVAFPWFGEPRYWQDRILELREQVALMSEPPLAPV
jgi:Ser/Thr protein kinase RdoA (MazF antagonist)